MSERMNEQKFITPPPLEQSTNRRDHYRLIEWAIENGYMLKMIYCKPTNDYSEEVTTRIILPKGLEGHLVFTELIATVRNEQLEISPENDYKRTFAVSRISEMEPFVFNKNE